ncbi:hypothetical protein MG290_14755 (plasmid) [Flavobacterium sp. CBA20B-1]|uniref:hypothetical protein n=1 Tax=unclassified Flavobacterium TaxID=196869 RepID=UPI002224EB40|nr:MULTISPECIES: hypothetical protein [unclassified Flavobacterium]WCM43603.1 hypothetical protein MG290_14755 [Flavobacterium sp. CBA20B-1]
MKRIANLLIDYGFSFDYENIKSKGNSINILDIGLKVVSQDGIIYFEYENEKEQYQDTEINFHYVSNKIEQILIKETV